VVGVGETYEKSNLALAATSPKLENYPRLYNKIYIINKNGLCKYSGNYSEGDIVDSIRIRNNPKISYHASGEFHLAGTVFPGRSMNSIAKTELIS
jgi:hypothetical protein